MGSPVFKVTFPKRGLEPYEFEDCLTSKVDELFKTIDIHQIVTLKKKSIKQVKKNVCIRVNRTNNQPDQRNAGSLSNLVLNGLLPDRQTTPMQEMQNTGGQRGRQRSDRRIIALYHNTQHDLFSNSVLSQKFKNLFPDIIVKEDNKGYFFQWHICNEYKLTTVECCDVIDKITTEYIKDFHELRQPNSNYDQAMREDLKKVYRSCQLILMGRVVVDWVNVNNLMGETGYKQWKNHILVEMSYAALLVVLHMIFSTLNSKPLPPPPPPSPPSPPPPPPPPPPMAIINYMKLTFLFIPISIIGLLMVRRYYS